MPNSTPTDPVQAISHRSLNPVAPQEPPGLHQALLLSIAVALGTGRREAAVLVAGACREQTFPDSVPATAFSTRVCLAKRLVRGAVFSLCSRAFSGALPDDLPPVDGGAVAVPIRMLPLHLKVVYLLLHRFAFGESEVTFILNTTLLQVRERNRKAVLFLEKNGLFPPLL